MTKITVKPSISIKKAMQILQKTAKKTLIVIDKNRKLLGTITDGDLRRSILAGSDFKKTIRNSYAKKPEFLRIKKYSKEYAKKIMRNKKLSLIPIVDSKNRYVSYISQEQIFENTKKTNRKKFFASAIIMAGGRGTRLGPFTDVLPKPLIPVAGKTIIERIINKFLNVGIKKIDITINHKAKILKSFFEEFNLDCDLNFVEERKQLGTAGSIKLLESKLSGSFFVTNCDILLDINLADLYKFHEKNNFLITIVAASKNYKIPYGVCEINSDKFLEKIKEKPKFNFFANTGMYVLNPKVIKMIPNNKNFDMTDLIEKVKKNNLNIGVYPIPENAWIDIGQWPEYQKTIKHFDEKKY